MNNNYCRSVFKYSTFFIGVFCFLPFLAFSQTVEPEEPKNKAKIFAVPVVFYLPETNFGFGAIGIATFRLKNELPSSRASQVSFGATYTLKKQILLYVPFELYKNNAKTRIKGELGYFKYFYNFFGVGPNSAKENKEFYNVKFPRFDINYSKAVTKGVYLGAGFAYDDFTFTQTKEDGILQTEMPLGHQGGKSALGYGLFFVDNRDNIFTSRKGIYFETRFSKSIGGSFNFTKLDADFRHFLPYKKVVLASQLFLSSVSKDAPFFAYPFVGNNAFSRGFANRRFINRHLINAQTELRYPIAWRFSGTAFTSLSWLPEKLSSPFSVKPKWAYGGGLRIAIDKKERTSVRIDLAGAKNSFNFYITANEAF